MIFWCLGRTYRVEVHRKKTGQGRNRCTIIYHDVFSIHIGFKVSWSKIKVRYSCDKGLKDTSLRLGRKIETLLKFDRLTPLPDDKF